MYIRTRPIRDCFHAASVNLKMILRYATLPRVLYEYRRAVSARLRQVLGQGKTGSELQLSIGRIDVQLRYRAISGVLLADKTIALRKDNGRVGDWRG